MSKKEPNSQLAVFVGFTPDGRKFYGNLELDSADLLSAKCVRRLESEIAKMHSLERVVLMNLLPLRN